MTQCPICEEGLASEPRTLGDPRHLFDKGYDCPRCGRFIKDQGPGFPDAIDPVRHLISAFIRRQNKADVIPEFRFDEYGRRGWAEAFERLGFPRSVTDKLDALMTVLGERAQLHADPDLELGDLALISEIAAVNKREMDRLVGLLEEQGLIKQHKAGRYRLSASGFLRLDQLRRNPGVIDAGFLAMWFDDSTTKYRVAAMAALAHCGYEPLVVDAQEYNGFIMDRVVADIRRSRFLIADFTATLEADNPTRPKIYGGARGGVYWEAGLAFGLGKQVIHTCHEGTESRRRTHFDIEQYNTIFWSDSDLEPEIRQPLPSDAPRLAERLVARILSTLGKGSYVSSRVR